MLLVARLVIPALWVAWAVYWLVMARRVKPVVWRESRVSRVARSAPLILVVLLLSTRRMSGWLGERWHEPSWSLFGLGVALVVAGLCVAVWARVALAGNWSGVVTIKEGHEIVRTGPYRWIRHPIYSGLLLAIIGSAVAYGQWRGLVAIALAAGAFWARIRLEERRLEEHFGAAYVEYRRASWAIIPFVY